MHSVKARVSGAFRGRATFYFPIWWYVAPTIINTFLESYDLSGKTVIPFATSGGSGMGKTLEGLKGSCSGDLRPGKMWIGNVPEESIRLWAESKK